MRKLHYFPNRTRSKGFRGGPAVGAGPEAQKSTENSEEDLHVYLPASLPGHDSWARGDVMRLTRAVPEDCSKAREAPSP